MHEIGYTLYSELLERAVKAIKAGRDPELENNTHLVTEVDLHIPALIPDAYLPDVHERLIMYKRIASAKDRHELRELQVEMIDRFGLLPEQTKNLFSLTEVKQAASPLGIRKLELGSKGGSIKFNDRPNIDPMKIISLIQTQAKNYKLEGKDKLRITLDLSDITLRLKSAHEIISLLKEPV